jgi:hypothetical protein
LKAENAPVGIRFPEACAPYRRAGFDGYIPRPIDPEGFVHQIEAYASARRRIDIMRWQPF